MEFCLQQNSQAICKADCGPPIAESINVNVYILMSGTICGGLPFADVHSDNVMTHSAADKGFTYTTVLSERNPDPLLVSS